MFKVTTRPSAHASEVKMRNQNTTIEDLQKRAEGTNVNPKSLLATDYLNHFNEALMLLEMVPDMPDMLEEVMEWQPKGYQDHFRDSVFSDKDLAIEAYEWAPERFRKPFDEAVAEVDRMILDLRAELVGKVETANPDLLREIVETRCEAIRGRMDVASSIIHGSAITSDRAAVDEMIADWENMADADDTLDQSAIDSLFD